MTEILTELARLRRERDAAVARADQLRNERDDAVQSCMVVGRERDEWKARAEAAERERDVAVKHRDQLHMQGAPTVTHADIEKVVGHWWARPGFQEDLENDLWALLSGDDPAVFVVRESDIAAVKAEQDEDGDWIVDGGFIAASQTTAETVRGWIPAYLRSATCLEAAARAIEAEQAADPVEAKARELFDATDESIWAWATAPIHTQDRYRRIARHVLGQEADQ